MAPRLLQEDLDHVLTHCETLWPDFAGAHLFVTGATGFFGKWMLESLLYANNKKALGLRITGLSRNPATFLAEMPHLAEHTALGWVTGDVRNFKFPEGKFTHIIHAATDASAKLNEEQPLTMFDTIVSGTRHVLDFALAAGVQNFLLVSSGAVYGRQPDELSHISEDFRGAPDTTDSTSAYAEGKRAAEMLCTIYARQYGLLPRIARCFAFFGPHLPLDSHFAAGNFLRDALNGGPIILRGNGCTVRSYMYAADLTIWLLTTLAKGVPLRAYNLGSPYPITTLELAERIADKAIDNPKILTRLCAAESTPSSRYVPAPSQLSAECDLQITISLNEMIERSFRWHRTAVR